MIQLKRNPDPFLNFFDLILLLFLLGDFGPASGEGFEAEASEKRRDSKWITAAKQGKSRRKVKLETAKKQGE